MPLHFDDAEFAGRVSRAVAALRANGLDAVLLFAPESQFWLTGYDTFGYAMFQCMVLGADGRIDLLTRAPDLRQAQFTSTLADDRIHIWAEYAGAEPAADLQALLIDRGLAGARLGIETRSAGLTAHHWEALRSAIGQDVTPADDLMQALRREKSPAEVAIIRRAAALSDDALEAGLAATVPGAAEGEILAAMQGAVLRGGGDYAGNPFILGSGPGALMCRSYSGRRDLDAEDHLTLEWSGAFAHYHAAMMRTVVIGRADAAQRRMHTACVAALEACEAALIPGAPMGRVFDAHARVFDRLGLSAARLQACGYGMGIAYPPIWVEFPMFTEGNALPVAAGQAYFLHMILMDSAAGLAMTLGHTVLVTETGPERLSRHGLELIEV